MSILVALGSDQDCSIINTNSADADLICYCFNYTASDIELDIVENGKSTILQRILLEKKNGGCHCATKNPKGR